MITLTQKEIMKIIDEQFGKKYAFSIRDLKEIINRQRHHTSCEVQWHYLSRKINELVASGELKQLPKLGIFYYCHFLDSPKDRHINLYCHNDCYDDIIRQATKIKDGYINRFNSAVSYWKFIKEASCHREISSSLCTTMQSIELKLKKNQEELVYYLLLLHTEKIEQTISQIVKDIKNQENSYFNKKESHIISKDKILLFSGGEAVDINDCCGNMVVSSKKEKLKYALNYINARNVKNGINPIPYWLITKECRLQPKIVNNKIFVKWNSYFGENKDR